MAREAELKKRLRRNLLNEGSLSRPACRGASGAAGSGGIGIEFGNSAPASAGAFVSADYPMTL